MTTVWLRRAGLSALLVACGARAMHAVDSQTVASTLEGKAKAASEAVSADALKKALAGALGKKPAVDPDPYSLEQLVGHAELTINFKPYLKLESGQYVIESMMAKGARYQNAFETGFSGGNAAFATPENLRNVAEKGMFGYAEFPTDVLKKGEVCKTKINEAMMSGKRTACPCDAASCKDRPLYVGVNIFRLARGATPRYGGSALILKRDNLAARVTITHSDSLGYFGQKKAAAAKVVGTLAHFRHVLLDFVTNGSLGVHGGDLKPWLEDALDRAHGRSPSRTNKVEEYWEAQVHGELPFAANLAGIRADFVQEFGTPHGALLAKWAVDLKVPLYWAFDDNHWFVDPRTAEAASKEGTKKHYETLAEAVAAKWKEIEKAGAKADVALAFNSLSGVMPTTERGGEGHVTAPTERSDEKQKYRP